MEEKEKVCDKVTPELIEDLIGAIWAAELDGWTDEEGARELENRLIEIAKECGIVEYEDEKGRRRFTKVEVV